MLFFCDMFNCRSTIFASILIFISCSYVSGGALPITDSNIDMILASNELVILNFYAEWCRFSNLLAPIFDKAADEVGKLFPEPSRVVLGKVNCDMESGVAKRFNIMKYPTLKIVRNGQPAKKEYRGQRSTEAFVEFVKKQLEDPSKEFHDLKELQEIQGTKGTIIGYFDRKDVPEYHTFRQVATNFKDDCHFYVGFGAASEAMHPPGEPIIVFIANKTLSNDVDETYKGSLTKFDDLSVWTQERCVPTVREITFENAEELTEEGLPFLILFYNSGDTETVKAYKKIVMDTLLDQKDKINFLIANGQNFRHPLYHLGKDLTDLPLIAIDSFRHMYLFPNYKDIFIEGKLKEFLNDLYSGKLHREFHYGPDTSQNGVPQIAGQVRSPTSPPESTFKKLAPSKNRYTILRDEL